jgi:TOMM system kinase/cyclase fusion protein
MLCPKCAFANPESAALCGHCGAALDSSRLHPERDAQSSSLAERRRLTVMFCDLVGSTALSGELDPEELHDLTRQYQRVCADVIGRHGGRVAQFLGDGLLVYFGYPIAHEDDAQRAVHAGLKIVAAISGLSAPLVKALQVRVAVHTGLAVVGHLGDGTDPDAMAIVGETPNIAARLQSIAEPGTVIISAPTYHLVEGFFHCRSLGTPALKGVAVPIELYSVLAESGIQSRFERAVASGLTPFVSRQAEVELLLQRLERAKEGAGQVVLLSGEAGIGKSRLIRVLKERATGEPVNQLAARCSPYYQDSALYPLVAFFQRFLQFQRDDTAETRLTTLERVLEYSGFPLSEFVPLFAALLSLPNDHRYPPPAMTPQRQKQKTFEAIVAWLLKAAQQCPTWVVVEDVHWADPSTLELLSLLIEQVSHSRLFVVVIFRSEFLPPWRSRSHVSSITLDRLPQAGIESMIGCLAGGKNLPPEVTREIAEKTEGVPLFVEELTRMVLESGLLREQDGRYELTTSLPSLAIPSTLYESLMARLDRLGTAKEVAQLAATIGKEFSYDLLRAVSSLDETRLTGALNRLVDAELLDQHLLSFQRSYSFRHALIRDAAYESLLRSKRRQYHGQIAAVLQKNFPEIVNANPELIAVHYTDAGLVEQAVSSWQRAGRRALERSANQEAIRHLTKGLDLLKLLPESPEHVQHELLMQTALGTALIATKGFPSQEVERIYARARQLCQQAGESPQLFPVLWGLWLFYTSRGKHIAARELGEQCLHLAESAGDTGLRVEAHHVLGVGLIASGGFAQALEHLEQAIGIYDPQEHGSHAYIYGHDPAAVGLIHASWALWFLGYPEQALKRYREGQALAQKLDHPYTSATAAAFAAWFHQFCRNPQGVEESASAAITISSEHDFVFYRAMGLIMRGWALTERSQVLEGIAQMRMGLDAYRITGGEVLRPSFLSLLADAYGKAGQAEQALSVLAEAQAVADESEERWWQAELYRLKGELILKRGGVQSSRHDDQDEAEGCFRQALAVARAQKAKSLELRAAMSLAGLWVQQSRRSEARYVMQEIFAGFTEGFDTPDLLEAKELLQQL